VNDALSVLTAAAIGGVAGVAGAAVAAVAALRASQLEARAPLAPKIHALVQTIIKMRGVVGSPDYVTRMKDFQIAWNDLIVHQRILLPSKRLTRLNELIRDAATDTTLTPNGFVALAADALNVTTEIIAAHANHLFRWRARLTERGIAKRFRQKTTPLLTSPVLLSHVKEL
jgi:hypothetical protein